jgi:molecular chaperone GrpE
MKKEEENTEQLAEETSQDERVAALEAELAESHNQLLRRTAELENMRRRHQQERTQLIFEANKNLIADLLATVDDLERTIAHIKPEEKNSFADGIELIYKNFLKVLESSGVRAIEAVGQKFDVHLHDALMEEPRSDIEPGTITTEVQKGYWMNDTVLRHAKVIVSKEAE